MWEPGPGPGTVLRPGPDPMVLCDFPFLLCRDPRLAGPGLQVLPIDDARARATQNIAVGSGSEFPRLASRLVAAILSQRSKQRFTAKGFEWRGR